MRIRNYLGISFGIWNGRQGWFWFIADSRCRGAVIGAAATEQDAIREARFSIEEMTARCSRAAAEVTTIA